MRKLLSTLVLVAALLGLSTPAYAEDALGLFNFLNILDIPQCLIKSYKCVPLGCRCKGIPCMDRVSHNVPVAFVETTVAPFTTTVPFLSTVLAALRAGDPTETGGSSTGSAGNYQFFFDAHVFDLPTRTFINITYPFLKTCPWVAPPFAVNYLSELDVAGWRLAPTDLASVEALLGGVAQISQVCPLNAVTSDLGDIVGLDIGIPGLGDLCMGTWGVTYPRMGWSNANSEPVASGIAAYRASRVTAAPVIPPASIPRVVLIPKPFLQANAKMQLGYPKKGSPLNCVSPGASPVVWDTDIPRPDFWNTGTVKGSPTNLFKGQGYIWVLWERVSCCMPPTGCIGVIGQ